MSKFSVHWKAYIEEKYPRKRDKTKKKIYNRLRSRVSRWKKEYEVSEDWISAELEKVIGTNCIYCEKEITVENVSLDHMNPIALGGSKTDTGNMRLIDMKCNTRKGRLTEDTYLELLETMEHFHWKEQDYILKKLASKDYGY